MSNSLQTRRQAAHPASFLIILTVLFSLVVAQTPWRKPPARNRLPKHHPRKHRRKKPAPKAGEVKSSDPPSVLVAAKHRPGELWRPRCLLRWYKFWSRDTGRSAKKQRSQTALIVRQHAVGSGVIVDPNGYIITNAHVVEGAQRIRIALPLPMNEPANPVPVGKRRILEARLLGVHKETDLALLKIDETDLPTLPLLTSSAHTWDNSCSPSAARRVCKTRSPWE